MKLRMPEMPSATLLAALAEYKLLPAIVFMPTRRRCDQAASEAALTRRDPLEKRRQERLDFMRAFVDQHPEVRNHRHYEKPSERRRRKMKVARFSAMLSARYADL